MRKAGIFIQTEVIIFRDIYARSSAIGSFMSNAFTELQFTSEPHTKDLLDSILGAKAAQFFWAPIHNGKMEKCYIFKWAEMCGRSLTANFVMNSNLFLAKRVLKLISTSNIKYVGTTQCNLYNEINSTATHGLHTQVHTHTHALTHIRLQSTLLRLINISHNLCSAKNA